MVSNVKNIELFWDEGHVYLYIKTVWFALNMGHVQNIIRTDTKYIWLKKQNTYDSKKRYLEVKIPITKCI